MPSWTHPTLGDFAFDSIGWIAELELPGFTSFDRNRTADNAASMVEMLFVADEPDEHPSEGMAQVAQNLVANHQRLLEDGLRIYFDDIHGIGHDSGMWWYGGIEQVNEILANHSKRLEAQSDLYLLLERPSISIQESGYGYDGPCAIIEFESPIDVEHGVGWLTDGITILGTGYSCDVSPNDGS